MIIRDAFDLCKYEPSKEAAFAYEMIQKEGKLDELVGILLRPEHYPEGIPVSTLDFFLQYNSELIYSWLGMETEEEKQRQYDEKDGEEADERIWG